ncbi:uncharacterized mitochondrial protein AtMg00810-like [Rutidosis leptorrhynchoides]|uniref:uncharacterized mitochondrial protein AtMg00810-like n=1 Tax=Rutidosis leptorrhynchoides TaxID=125765 RepID=UPI003A99E007
MSRSDGNLINQSNCNDFSIQAKQLKAIKISYLNALRQPPPATIKNGEFIAFHKGKRLKTTEMAAMVATGAAAGDNCGLTNKGTSLINRKSHTFSTQKSTRETGMIDCKPADTPMIPNQKLYMEDEADLADKGQYQWMVGKVIYLAHTRSDIAHAVGVVSQFMHQPQVHHMEAVIRIIRYLKKTAGHGVVFKKNGHLETKINTDASWAGEKGDRRSTSDFFTIVGGNLVSWKSKKQKVVSLSSVKSEFMKCPVHIDYKRFTIVDFIARYLTSI